MREMRDSGVEWIGNIPETWDLVQLGSLFSEHKDKNTGMQSRNLLSLSYGNIIRKDINTSDGLLPESFEGYNVIDAGDIVLRLTDLQNDQRSLRVGLSHERGIVTSAYVTLRKRNPAMNSHFFYYLIHSYDVRKGFYGMGAGVRQGLNFVGIRRIMLPLPPADEQTAIATFLGKRIAQVDTLVANVQAQIEKLKAYKQSVITEVVTRGLDPTVPMKDSGVRWISNVPEHWEVIQAKYCTTINHGSDPKTEGNVPVYGSGAESFKTCGEYKDGPVVLVGRKGATLHIPHYIEGRYWNVDTAFDVSTNSLCDIKYYYYMATSFDYKYYMSQTTLPGMTQFAYRNMYLPLPPIEEQEKIVYYLEVKCAQIDRLIALKQYKIAKLEQYKRSLIYEYVTGKKEVS